MKVWLDDLRDPNDPQIQKKYGASDGMIWVKTVREAIDLLSTGEVNHISLDNDLGSGCPEGYEVACWIEEKAFNGELGRLRVKIHTDNPVAREKMKASLRNAYRSWMNTR